MRTVYYLGISNGVLELPQVRMERGPGRSSPEINFKMKDSY
jgi:hypothetical protein